MGPSTPRIPVVPAESAGALARGTVLDYVRLARPHQWLKSVFVAVGPLYALTGETGAGRVDLWVQLLGAIASFALASSGCYVINDLMDREADRAHPRKCRRPIASGAIGANGARLYAALLFGLAAAVACLVPSSGGQRWWLLGLVTLYVLNVTAYSLSLKHVVIVDVMSLALGFVLRVLAGCAATGVEPSTWLLNSAFFLAMFLSFGKRLGERRTVGDADPATVRRVHAAYTDDLLRMVVVVTGVAVLLTYAGYVQAHAARYTFGSAAVEAVAGAAGRPAAALSAGAEETGGTGGTWGFNLLWITMIPATFALFRCILMLERGRFDDPTELAAHDRPFQLSAVLFAVLTSALVWASQR